MKANELKLGDIVKCGEKVVKVTALGNTGVCISDLKNISESWGNYINLTPIPLTKEILEKNDWIKDRYNSKLYSKDLFELRDWENHWDFCMRNGYDVIKVESVHQLQQILWVLGFDDNLKI